MVNSLKNYLDEFSVWGAKGAVDVLTTVFGSTCLSLLQLQATAVPTTDDNNSPSMVPKNVNLIVIMSSLLIIHYFLMKCKTMIVFVNAIIVSFRLQLNE